MDSAGLFLGPGFWESFDDRAEAPRTETVASDPVDEGVNTTGSLLWGRLLPLDEVQWPGIVFADRYEDFPGSKPQGYVVGRDFECDLVVDHQNVSNRQCLIYRVVHKNQVYVFLKDLSSNGTFVNKSLVGCNQTIELKDGNEVTFGHPTGRGLSQMTPVHQQQQKKKVQQQSMMQDWSVQYDSAGSDQEHGESLLEIAQHLHQRPNFRGRGFHPQKDRRSMLLFNNNLGPKDRSVQGIFGTKRGATTPEETFESPRFVFRSAGPIHRTFAQQYTILNFLGEDHLGKGFSCKENATGKLFAVKMHDISAIPSGRGTIENIAAESILMGLCHKNIIFMKEVFSDDYSSSHIIQLVEGGDLFDLIVRKSKLSEGETRHIFQQLFAAVKYLHDRNVVHRDLKPENILILDEKYSIVLCSFDFSIVITAKSFDTTLCGSPSYVAPEVLADRRVRKYGREVDIWSLGIVLYTCFCGFLPFSDELYSKESPYTLEQQIKLGRFDYPSPHWDSVGFSALDLIDNMLVVDPRKRFTIEQCLSHPWLTQLAPGEELVEKQVPLPHRGPKSPTSVKQVLSPSYSASSEESELPRVEASLRETVNTPFETKGKEKLPPINDIYDIGKDLKKMTLDEEFSEDHLRKASLSKVSLVKATLSKALNKANTAIQLDSAQDLQGARTALLETCNLLHSIELLIPEDSKKEIEKIASLSREYMGRVIESDCPLPPDEQGDNVLPQRQVSATEVLRGSQHSSAVQPAYVDKHVREKAPMTDYMGRMMSLEYDSFTKLVNGVIDRPAAPETPSAHLPEDVQIDMEFNDKGKDLSTWTCTPLDQAALEQIPLRVDGHPVVLPVEYKYPLTGMFSPPPDPHPRFISPSATLSQEDINHIFSAFPACIGFYLLINGSLQFIMPDGFDYEEGLPILPSDFGGLKVSLIPDAISPTAGEPSSSSPSATTTSTRTALERIFGRSSSQTTGADPATTNCPASKHPVNAVGVSVGCAIRAVVPGSKSKQRFEGKTGLVIRPCDDASKKYITIPTHLLTDSVLASRTTSLDSDTWRDDVKVCVASNSAELGKVTAVFDVEPKSFPVGFSHDVSLVDISGVSDIPRTIPYATDLTWLSQQEWMDIKYNSSNLVLLDDRSREAKSIGIVDSRCQMVGQGIFRIQQQSRKRSSFLGSLSAGSNSSRPQDPRDDPSTWTSLVARSILYRVNPDYPVRGGQSGVPVCVVSESTDGTASRSTKVAGFASFVQMVSDVQKYDLEGDKLYKRLQEGRVAFYGAFQVPQELREGYQIL